MLVLRAAFALLATAVAVWCLRSGLPLGAVAVVAVAVLVRRSADSGRLARLVAHRPV